MFSKLIILFFLFTSFLLTKVNNNKLNLMPFPLKVNLLEGKFILDSTFSISINGMPANRIYSYSTRVLRRLSGRTGLFFLQDFITKENFNPNSQMQITCKRNAKVELNENESYSLFISPKKIELKSENDLGALRGLETLLQLLTADDEGYFFPCTEIEDKPRFPWRGLMIDVSRHFMPIDVIKRNLDAMAAVKMNVFHWHLSDDQGFRVESFILPKLHQLCSDGLYYTQVQIKEIIEYADERGIRVYPEFDIPGHSTAFFTAYPELASAPGPYKIERNWGVFDPTFNPTIEETYIFFDKLFGEMTKLFPDPYFHIGGDENNGKQWNTNESIQSFMKKNKIKDNHALQSYFNNRILKILTKYGKMMIGWDEILHPEMPNNIVIQSWRGTKSLIESAQKGYMGILSNGYYIDLIQSTEFHYLNDPIPANSNLSDEEKKFILGGEATSWGELVTLETVDSRIWPRTAAIAERFWSPEIIKDVDNMYRRIETISFQLEELGLLHKKNYEMMLRRLTNNNDISSLKILVDILEPVKIYTRHRQGKKYQQQSPFTRVVDAAQPDAKTAREFRKLIDLFLKDKKSNKDEIESWLMKWRDNHKELIKTINKSPVIKEIEQLSKNLENISISGLESLSLILTNKPVNKQWLDDKLLFVKQAKIPYGQAELMVVSAIEKLINAVNVE